MKTKRVKPLKILLLLAVILQISSACQKRDRDGGFIPNLQSDAKPAQGTGHTGGGNGINGRIYEDYVVDPMKLKAFELLKPILLREQTNPDGTVENRGVSLFFFMLKTWYIAPVELKPIDKDILGVGFSEDENDQLALQTNITDLATDREVWIDSKYYDDPKVSDEARAKLILHEFVMTAYLLKFKTIEQICQITNELGVGELSDCTSAKEIDKMQAPPVVRPLDKDDYKNIRRVTSWLWAQGAKATLEEINNKFYFNGFDKRFFKPRNLSAKPVREPIVMKPESLHEILASHIAINALPNTCRFLENGRSAPCGLRFLETVPYTVEAIGTNGAKSSNVYTYRKMILDLPTEKLTFDYRLEWDANTHAYPVEDPATGEELYLLMMYDQYAVNPVVGQKKTNYALLLKKKVRGDFENYEVKAILIKPVVITKVQQYTCESDSMKNPTLEQDAIVMTFNNDRMRYLEYLSEHSMLGAACMGNDSPDTIKQVLIE